MVFLESLLREATAAFLDEECTFAPAVGGVNNSTYFLTRPSGERLVLRIYNNGNDRSRVRYEHAVLSALRAQPLPFCVPIALPARGSGLPHAELSSGAEAALFELIPCSLPGLGCARAIGAASGALAAVLATVLAGLDHLESPQAPYYDLYDMHHATKACGREGFLQAVARPEMDGVRASMDFLVAQIAVVEAAVGAARCEGDGLPMGLIHGDLHYDNVLVTPDGVVSGLLDFEFCARDLRAMELAICLSKYCGEAEPAPYLTDFISGYCSTCYRLTAVEARAVPTLVVLRIVSNIVFFVGRALAGEDEWLQLTSRAENYAKRVRWLGGHGAWISEQIVAATPAAAT